MEFGVLGPLQVTAGGSPIRLGDRRSQTVLALLLVNFRQTVSFEYLMDAVWDDHPPATAKRQLQNCVAGVRRLLADGHQVGSPGIITSAQGYRLPVEPARVDAEVFTEQVRLAQHLATDRRWPEAVSVLRSARRLWRGPALLGLTGQVVEAAAARLNEERLAAVEWCFDLELGLGRYAELVAELSELVVAHPLRERLVGQLMRALHGSGRQAEALHVYQRVRRQLADGMGLDPGLPLQRLQSAILANDAELGLLTDDSADEAVGVSPAVPDPTTTPVVAELIVPAQLPADVATFTGRAEQLGALDALAPDDPAGAARNFAVVAGLAGVGKTSLAVHWGHLRRDRFPDGQLYVDLVGHGPGPPMLPAAALGHLLRSLGVPDAQVPTELQTAVGQYRTLLSGKRMLVVLDNAAAADQVRPLLPGSSGCVALVTTRSRLPGLVASDNAQPLPLDVLSTAEARELLTRILGADRVADEPDAVASLAAACSFLPLALRVAAANLTNNPWPSVADYVAALRGGDRLTGLEIGGDERAGVRYAFDLSYQALPVAAQRLFRLLGLIPGADISAPAAAALGGIAADEAAARLALLATAHLVTEPAPGRYAFHDLVRRYAADLAAETESDAARDAALRRLEDWYLHRADAAAKMLYPHRLRLAVPPYLGPASAADDPESDPAAALAWLDAENSNLVSVVRAAASRGRPQPAWLLTDTLRGYFWLRVRTNDWADAAELALIAATGAGDTRAQAMIRLSLGDLHYRQSDHRAAIEHYSRALDASEQADWPEAVIAALGNLGVTHRDSGSSALAARYLDRALTACRAAGSRYGEAITLGCLGNTYWQLGRLVEAAQYCRGATELNRELGSRLGEASALGDLGEVLRVQGNLDEAMAHLADSLAIFRELGDVSNEASVLCSIAAVHRDRGCLAEAAEAAHAALATVRSVADDRIHAEALNALGSVSASAGHLHDSVSQHRQALALSRTFGLRFCEVGSLIGLARAREGLGQFGPALVDARRATELAEELGFALLRESAAAIVHRLRSTPVGAGSVDDRRA